jgi:cilla- and flagella-associated protein
MSKSLTPELVLLKTKAGSLENVKNLNLWGNELEDVRILKDMPNIEVLSLSVNKISTLKPFQYCKKLSELYLRKNLISDLSEIRYIKNLPSLKVLWLWDNPCADAPNYREIVISVLPNLIKLDNQPVTNEERAQSDVKEGKGKKEESKELLMPRDILIRRDKEEIKEIGGRDDGLRRDASPALREKPRPRPKREEVIKTDNVLCAVLALIKEQDGNSLEIVKREIEKRIIEINNR